MLDDKWDKDKILSEPIGDYFSMEEEVVFDEIVSEFNDNMVILKQVGK